ncbi:MAG TPA: FhaA domain-containing protein [Candidatus Nitrosotenuis sp.]|jgi:hypothetical protein|nr:FhaA domain-containing protein [Candidatus Nitrosotenuis sp.]
MNWLRRVERALEESLEGAPPLRPHPLELARRLERALVDGARRLGRARYAPNRFVCRLPEPPGPETEGLAGHLAQVARDRGYRLVGPLEVEVLPGPGEIQGFFTGAGGGPALGLVEGLLGPAQGLTAVVPPEGLVVGRGEEVGLRLADPGVSRQHLRVSVLEGRVLLEDLGSRNGTRVGRRRLEAPAEVPPGARVELGESTLRVWVL